MQPDSQLKDLAKSISDLLLLVSDVSQGLSLKELNEMVTLAEDIPEVVADASTLLSQYLALDDAARADVETYIGQTVTFPANANVQNIVQKVLQGFIYLSGLAAII